MTSRGFYRAFEERYRGSRELIRKRLTAYLPFITPLRDLYPDAQAIDLGCGRGEWIELLRDNGFDAKGVDLDREMLAACDERGLSVVEGDAIACLQSLPDSSQCIVSGFHIAEHIAFNDLENLVIHALRVLKPGGVLIMETPNPENLVVGTNNFYLDPTHIRPIPPLLLSFIPEYHGFDRVCTVRLQERSELREKHNISLMDVLNGVSPDFGIVAQKTASEDMRKLFDADFSKAYGIKLADLANRYDKRTEERLGMLDSRLSKIEESGKMLMMVSELQDEIFKKTEELVEKKHKIDKLEKKIREGNHARQVALTREKEMATRLRDANIRLQAIDKSISWRITAPLRWGGNVLHPASIRDVMRSAIFYVLARPALAEKINNIVIRLPWLHERLKSIAVSEYVSKSSKNNSFDDFVRDKLIFQLKPVSEFHSVERERLKIYTNVMEEVIGSSGMKVNIDLLHAIRSGESIDQKASLTEADRVNAEILVRHIYIGLLRRYPNKGNERAYAAQMIAGKTVKSVIDRVRSSDEYKLKNIQPQI